MEEKKEVTLWICGLYQQYVYNYRHKEELAAWELVGVFETQEEAIKACLDETYFIAPAILGKILQINSTEWEGSYYPITPHENHNS